MPQSEVLDSAPLLDKLINILGPEGVSKDEASRQFYSQDLSFLPRAVPAAVIIPKTVEELAQAVGASTAAGYAVVPRGGGMSYTGGYLPTTPRSILVDTRKINRIVEINEKDMYVSVETGCTWKALNEALAPLGLRTPYFGPLSGAYATVGGTLSQNSLFFGSGIYGTVADSVIGFKVVLADGSIMTTGSGAHKHSNPFWRHFGPDMTGIFTADCGAFGIKAVVVLRLIRAPKATEFLSFKFETEADMVAAQTELSRAGVASECYGFDPCYHQRFEKQGMTFEEGISVVGKVARKGGLRGIGSALKMAAGGKKILRNIRYSVHMTLDGATELIAEENARLAREICAAHNGVEMTNTIPTVFRAAPFGGVRTLILGPEGELWISIHGFFPLSNALDAVRATEAFMKEKAAEMAKWNVEYTFLTAFAGSQFVIEPMFYWADALGDFRLSLIEPEFQERWKDNPEALERREFVLGLRRELRDRFDRLGGLHLQLGKYYPYLDHMNNPELVDLIKSIKSRLDPNNLMNPGALGLGVAD